MPHREQTHGSAFPDPNAATSSCAAGTRCGPHSETTPTTAGRPEPETASAPHRATASMRRSPSGCNSAPASCSRTPHHGVPAPARCDPDRVAGSASSSCTRAPASGHSAASPSVHAGASGQPSWRRHVKRDCLAEHKQPQRGHSAAGQHLSTPAGSERGDNQSGSLSAYRNHPGTQSGCDGSSQSSRRHGASASSACCSASCSACHVHSDTHNQLHACPSGAERWREAAGAHSPAPRSASSQQSPSGDPGVVFSVGSSNSTDHHCERPGFRLATHEDL